MVKVSFMNKTLLSTIALACLVLASCDDRPVPVAEVPQDIQVFIQQNFVGSTMTYAQRDLGLLGWEYDVTLSDGTIVKFDSDHTWDQVSCAAASVPAALVPAPIATYLNANFPGVAITKIDKESNGYDVDLASGLELKFNSQGALMEMDD